MGQCISRTSNKKQQQTHQHRSRKKDKLGAFVTSNDDVNTNGRKSTVDTIQSNDNSTTNNDTNTNKKGQRGTAVVLQVQDLTENESVSNATNTAEEIIVFERNNNEIDKDDDEDSDIIEPEEDVTEQELQSSELMDMMDGTDAVEDVEEDKSNNNCNNSQYSSSNNNKNSSPTRKKRRRRRKKKNNVFDDNSSKASSSLHYDTVIPEADDSGNENLPSDEEEQIINIIDHDDDDDVVSTGIIKTKPEKLSPNKKKRNTIGKLSPVKYKTQLSTSPDSIQIHDPIMTMTSPDSNAPTPKASGSSNSNNNALTTTTSSPSASVPDAAVISFQKLKLQVQVASERSKRQHKIAKIEDRVQDVEGYKQLWKEFEQIQGQVVENNGNLTPHQDNEEQQSIEYQYEMHDDEQVHNLSSSTGTGTAHPNNISNHSGYSSSKSISSVRSWWSHNAKSFRCSRKHKRYHHTQQQQESVIIFEAEDSPRKAISNGGTPTATTPKSRGTPNSAETKKSQKSKSSFDLKTSKTWFFDFKDGFDTVTGSTSVNSSNSQANLSLLSESSMEAQRRLFAEKRRQRRSKKSSNKRGKLSNYCIASVAETSPPTSELENNEYLQETPLVCNGRRGIKQREENILQQQQQEEPVPMPKQQQPPINDYGPRPRNSNSLTPPSSNSTGLGKAITDMQVEFHTPSPEQQPYEDTGSIISDLDDSVASADDYGVRRRLRGRSGGGGTSDSYCNNTDSSSAIIPSDEESFHRVKYDHNAVLQRRLDIEARLKALMAQDDDDNSEKVLATSSPGEQLDESSYKLPTVASPDNTYSQRKRLQSEEVYPITLKDYYPKSPTQPQTTEVIDENNVNEEYVASKEINHSVNVVTPAVRKKDSMTDESPSPEQTLNETLKAAKTKPKRDYQAFFNQALLNSYIPSSYSSTNTEVVYLVENSPLSEITESPKNVDDYGKENDEREKISSSGLIHNSLHSLTTTDIGSTTPNNNNTKDSRETREALKLADQVEARVQRVLAKYRAGGSHVDDDDDEEPPRIISRKISMAKEKFEGKATN